VLARHARPVRSRLNSAATRPPVAALIEIIAALIA